MGHDGAGGLPDRTALAEQLGQMLSTGLRPAVYVVAVDGFDELARRDPAGADAAMAETARRLDRLVRRSDVLGSPQPGTFVLIGSGVEPSVAGALVERIQGAAALPVDLAGEPVSLRVDIGLAFAMGDSTAASLLERAEDDLRRSRRAS
jgi:GGDEF domain-containing protein